MLVHIMSEMFKAHSRFLTWCNVSLQRLLADMEGLKQQVVAVQMCQSALRVPEEVMPSLNICRTALRLQQEASQLQHVAIQQCNILQVQQPFRVITEDLI